MIKKIDFFTPETSQYGVLHYFTQKLYEAFCYQGYECRLLKGKEILKYPCQDPPDLTIGFNGVPQHPSGVFLCDLIERPHFCYLVDLSYRYLYLTESPYMTISCVDQFSCDLLKMKNFQKTFFLAQAVEKETTFDPTEVRPYDIVLLATFIDYEKRRKEWPLIFSPIVCKILDHAIEIFFSDISMPFILAFQQAFNDRLQREKIAEDETIDFNRVFKQLELYIRGKHRVNLVKAIKDVPIHIFDSSIDSRSWKDYFKKQKNLIFHPSISFEENFDVLKKSKLVLNSSPHISNGGHERVFNSLACGALPLTESNAYWMKHFQHEKEILFFNHSQPEHLNEIIHFYLTHEVERVDIALNGQKKVMKEHTWNERAKTIIEMI